VSDEGILLAESVRRLFSQYDHSLILRGEKGEWLPDQWRQIEEMGLPLALRPEESGGFGLDPAEALQIVGLAGEYAIPLPIAEVMLAGWVLAHAGMEMPEGAVSVGYAGTAGPVLKRHPDGWSVSGSVLVPWGRHVAAVVVIAEHDGRSFAVCLRSSAWTAITGANLAGEPRDTLQFDTILPLDQVGELAIGFGGDDLHVAGAAMRCLAIAGALRRVLEISVAYANERKQFGRPIGKFQVIQQNLAVLATYSAAAAAAASKLAGALFPQPETLAVAVAKVTCGEAAGTAAALAHQIHGAIGFSQEHSLNLFTRRLWSWRDEFGSESEWARMIGRQAVTDGADQLWPLVTSIGMMRPAPSPTSDPLEALRANVRQFLVREVGSRSAAERAQSWNGFDADFSRKMGERGWIGMTWPKRYGGGERSSLERYVILEEVLAAGAPVAAHWIADRQSGMLLLNFGNEEQRSSVLPRIAAGECFFCIGMSEPDAGSDLAAVRTRAEKVEGGWKVNGTKLWTTYAHRAHYMILFCRTDAPSDDRHAGTSQFLVDMNRPGITISPVIDMAGSHHFNEVSFTDVFLPDSALIGQRGDGWKQVMSELSFERSGPERFLSSFTLLRELVRVAGSNASEGACEAIGRIVAQLTTLREMSRSVAAKLGSGEDPSLDACFVKDLGTAVEQQIPEVARLVAPVGSTSETGESITAAFAVTLLSAPSFSLRGGTREIIRGIIARNLGLR
jgi:alkylation response protein AidB-like acyl-CoA dehydrogenase